MGVDYSPDYESERGGLLANPPYISRERSEATIADLRAENERLRGYLDDLAFGLDAEQAEVVRLCDGIRRFLAYEDTHEPGPYVKDGNWHPGPCVEGGPRMEDVYPDGFQICADEDCGVYWPCPTAELAALLDDRTETT